MFYSYSIGFSEIRRGAWSKIKESFEIAFEKAVTKAIAFHTALYWYHYVKYSRENIYDSVRMYIII